VDVLINNAGILQTTRDVTEDGFEMNLGVNYLGNLTIRLFCDSFSARLVSVIVQ